MVLGEPPRRISIITIPMPLFILKKFALLGIGEQNINNFQNEKGI
jgi:hypothetical protein